MKISINELVELSAFLESTDIPHKEALLSIINADIKRRKNSGRKKKSNLDEKTQGRLAQRRYQHKRELTGVLEEWNNNRAQRFAPVARETQSVNDATESAPSGTSAGDGHPPWI